jgi:hypothetical protein
MYLINNVDQIHLSSLIWLISRYIITKIYIKIIILLYGDRREVQVNTHSFSLYMNHIKVLKI